MNLISESPLPTMQLSRKTGWFYTNLPVCCADNNIGCRGADAMASVLHSANFSLTTLDLTGTYSALIAVPACPCATLYRVLAQG